MREWLAYGAKTHKWKILLGIKFADKKENKNRKQFRVNLCILLNSFNQHKNQSCFGVQIIFLQDCFNTSRYSVSAFTYTLRLICFKNSSHVKCIS